MNETTSERASEGRFGIGTLVVVVCVLSAVIAHLAFVSLSYPVHFMWDMDHVTTIDLVVIGSGLAPAHIIHPGAGMYLILGASHRLAYELGMVSTLGFDDLSTALHPLWNVGELTTFVRLHGLLPALVTVGALWLSLVVAFAPSPALSVVLLLALGLAPSLTYQASVVRTEIYAAMFWALSVFACAVAARRRGGRGLTACLVAAGLLAGLCVVTKVQGLVHALCAPLVFWFFRSRTPHAQQASAPVHPAWPLANLVALVLLLIAVGQVEIPAAFGVFRAPRGFGLNPVAGLLLATAIALLGLALSEKHTRGRFPRVLDHAWPAHAILSGALAAFVLPVLVVHPLGAESLEYARRVGKMVLFSRDLSMRSVGGGPSGALALLPAQMPVACALLAMWLLVLAGRKELRRPALWLLALVLAALAMAQFCLRDLLRDMLWSELFMLLLALAAGLTCLGAPERARRRDTLLVVAATVLLALANVTGSQLMHRRIDALYRGYAWSRKALLVPIMEGSQAKYRSIIDAAYTDGGVDLRVDAARTLPELPRARGVAASVFPNQALTLGDVGYVAQGFRARAHDPSVRLRRVPPQLRGGFLVDGAHAHTFSFTISSRALRRSSWDLLAPSSGEAIALAPRKDLDIFLFVPAGQPGLAPRLQPSGLTIELGNATGTRDYAGYVVYDVGEIPRTLYGGDFFFVIRDRAEFL